MNPIDKLQQACNAMQYYLDQDKATFYAKMDKLPRERVKRIEAELKAKQNEINKIAAAINEILYLLPPHRPAHNNYTRRQIFDKEALRTDHNMEVLKHYI